MGDGEMTLRPNTWTMLASGINREGKSTRYKSSTTFSSDGKTRATKGELSVDDGKTWMPLWEQVAKRVAR